MTRDTDEPVSRRTFASRHLYRFSPLPGSPVRRRTSTKPGVYYTLRKYKNITCCSCESNLGYSNSPLSCADICTAATILQISTCLRKAMHTNHWRGGGGGCSPRHTSCDPPNDVHFGGCPWDRIPCPPRRYPVFPTMWALQCGLVDSRGPGGVPVRATRPPCRGKPPDSPVEPVDFDRHISGYRVTQTASLGDPYSIPRSPGIYPTFPRPHGIGAQRRILKEGGRSGGTRAAIEVNLFLAIFSSE